MEDVLVSRSFDNIRSRDIRFLEEAAKFGHVHVCLWSDWVVQRITGADPMFPQEERKYLLEAVRYVDNVVIVDQISSPDELPPFHDCHSRTWVAPEAEDTAEKRQFCRAHGITYRVIQESTLREFSVSDNDYVSPSTNKKVLVTGCFDWFHSGHVRFFEETSQLGDLYVVVGHDANVRLLKGEGHPLFPEEERRYMAGAARFVSQALISSGHGWMDAEPEIERIRPDIYAVNEDGDKREKKEFCREHGLEYVVLKRTPAMGLPRRESTHLRGF